MYPKAMINHTTAFLPPKEWIRESDIPAGAFNPHSPDGSTQLDGESRKKKKATLNKTCWVCGSPAAEHVHYGAICCYSCRAFFRRSGARNYQCIRGDLQCEVNTKYRKYCKKCRYLKCLEVGMKPELVDASLRNREADFQAETTSIQKCEDGTELAVHHGGMATSSVKQEVPASGGESSRVSTAQPPNQPATPRCSSVGFSPRPNISSPASADHYSISSDFTPPMIVQDCMPGFYPPFPQPFGMLTARPMIPVAGQSSGCGGEGRREGMEWEGRMEMAKGKMEFERMERERARMEVERARIERERELMEKERERMERDRREYERERMEREMARMEMGRMDMGRMDMGRVDIGRVDMGRMDMGRVDMRRVDMGRMDMGRVDMGRMDMGREEMGRMDMERMDIGGMNMGRIEMGRVKGEVFPKVSTIMLNSKLLHNSGSSLTYKKGDDDDAFDIKADDCTSGLCNLPDDQVGISKNIFNVSSVVDTKNQRMSVIQAPRKTNAEDLKKPFKKRTCNKMCKNYFRRFLFCEPVIKLTWEEKKFIDKRVTETRMLVSMVQPQPELQDDYGLDTFQEERSSALDVFKQSFEGIFGKLRANNLKELEGLGLIESRFFCCALTSIAVRLFGGTKDGAIISNDYTAKYASMLRSPWACSYEEEEKVVATLRQVGELIGGDEMLEVLFTTCIMRGFQDPRSAFMQLERGNRHTEDKDKQDKELPNQQDFFDEPGHPARNKPMPEDARCACEDPNMLTGVQFSLLMYRYLKDGKSQEKSADIFKKLEGLIKPLYECQNIFYYARLPV